MKSQYVKGIIWQELAIQTAWCTLNCYFSEAKGKLRMLNSILIAAKADQGSDDSNSADKRLDQFGMVPVKTPPDGSCLFWWVRTFLPENMSNFTLVHVLEMSSVQKKKKKKKKNQFHPHIIFGLNFNPLPLRPPLISPSPSQKFLLIPYVNNLTIWMIRV